MRSIRKCVPGDYPALVQVWERSVRASHHFLSEDDIVDIRRRLASVYFPHVDLSCVEENGVIAGFIGIVGDKIEMLFVDAAYRGKGIGTMLVDSALVKGAVQVDVNEQNPSALAFYAARGFKVVSRDATDEAGRPYPILHLSL